MNAGLFHDMRLALSRCSFQPGSAQKRFVRDIQSVPIDQVTEAQQRYVVCLAWRYRRQMPRALVPSKDAIDAFTAEFKTDSESKAAARASRRKRPPLPDPFLPLFTPAVVENGRHARSA